MAGGASDDSLTEDSTSEEDEVQDNINYTIDFNEINAEVEQEM
jgi:hypothetical protein